MLHDVTPCVKQSENTFFPEVEPKLADMFASAVILILAEYVRKMLLIVGVLMALIDLYACMTYAVKVYCTITTFCLLLSFM